MTITRMLPDAYMASEIHPKLWNRRICFAFFDTMLSSGSMDVDLGSFFFFFYWFLTIQNDGQKETWGLNVLKESHLVWKALMWSGNARRGGFLLRGAFEGSDTSAFGKKRARISTKGRTGGDCAWNRRHAQVSPKLVQSNQQPYQESPKGGCRLHMLLCSQSWPLRTEVLTAPDSRHR